MASVKACPQAHPIPGPRGQALYTRAIAALGGSSQEAEGGPRSANAAAMLSGCPGGVLRGRLAGQYQVGLSPVRGGVSA